ncbi:MAG: nucleoside/nucleotide kinase family protein [Propionibacteriales bacterium]|nr:nucleoside/nucleotide kinase family protein [Propionibacteriales bacterium]
MINTVGRRAESITTDELVRRATALAEGGQRRILGITGAPGSGKSTVAAHLAKALGSERAVVVPMDGFHLANVTLRAWGRRDRKGAWDTFDVEGYVHLLRRLRAGDPGDASSEMVHAPDFDRTVDESIGSAIPIRSSVPLVITEGNYLLSRRGAWAQVRGLLDESWFLDVDDTIRIERLVRRHARHGMDVDHAVAWARGTDQTNAETVRPGRAIADHVLCLIN